MKIKLILLFVLAGFSVKSYAQTGFPFDNEIRDFKHKDSLSFPKPDGILFIGSSSIRKWDDLEKRFADKNIIRRGVGGCELSQLVKYYTPYILFPYHPAKIFIYAGENDIAAGEKADSVLTNMKALWTMINSQLQDAKIYFLSIKPSPSRIKLLPEMLKANDLIKAYLQDKPNTLFIDVSTPIYKTGTTEPDPSLFLQDMLHLNPTGYDKWQAVLQKYVD
jgi:hypothetical protein